jgi:ankyrin repeat protein
LKINEKNKDEIYPIIGAVESNNIDTVKLLIDYANKNNIILDIKGKDQDGSYPILFAIEKDNIEMAKILINYVDNKNIILDIDEKDDIFEWCPLFYIIFNKNVEMAKLLIDYANKTNIILNINEKDDYGTSAFLQAIYRNNIEMIKLLIDYSNKKNILLDEINPIFLHPCNTDVEIGDPIAIFQYPQTEYSLAFGKITAIHSFDYYHEVSTMSGSSGSPLLNKNFEVIGIHKSKIIDILFSILIGWIEAMNY